MGIYQGGVIDESCMKHEQQRPETGGLHIYKSEVYRLDGEESTESKTLYRQNLTSASTLAH